MKHILLPVLCLFSCVLLFPSCEEKEEKLTGNLEIIFKPTFGAEPLYMFERSYNYRGDAAIKWQVFQFYLSDLELLPANATTAEVMLSPVESVSFSEMQNESEAQAGYALRFNGIETGSYSGFRFGLGVSPELNATKPSDYKPSEPLAQSSNYWDAASSYIFSKIEGNADLDNDGQFGENEEKITFHHGASELFQKRTLGINAEIRENSTTTLVIYVDLLRALQNETEGTFIDLRQTPRDHHTNPDVYNFVLNQLRERAISIGN